MKNENLEFLKWLFERLIYVHNEDINLDYMIKFKRIISSLEPDNQKEKLVKKFENGAKLYNTSPIFAQLINCILYDNIDETEAINILMKMIVSQEKNLIEILSNYGNNVQSEIIRKTVKENQHLTSAIETIDTLKLNDYLKQSFMSKEMYMKILLEGMNLGMGVRQDQLNGFEHRSGEEVLKDYVKNKE